MKLIIAGSRTIEVSPYFLTDLVYNFFPISREYGQYSVANEIVSGTAKGMDRCGEAYALHHSIPIKKFPADWDLHGKAAGHIRNKQMAEYADALLLVWDGISKGSANMKENMLKLGKPVYEVILTKHKKQYIG